MMVQKLQLLGHQTCKFHDPWGSCAKVWPTSHIVKMHFFFTNLIYSRGHYRPKSVKQVATATLPNAWQQVRVSQVLRDDHYKWMPHVTVGMAR